MDKALTALTALITLGGNILMTKIDDAFKDAVKLISIGWGKGLGTTVNVVVVCGRGPVKRGFGANNEV